ncbi:hypothetical protein B566_EDAN018974 [Ephemera danica]|nr:hypothetical protein B566_EDAN018974 [Ephemera danica]
MTDFVFLHGGGQGGWVWDETIAAMALQTPGAHRYLALDAPGCGAKRGRDTAAITFDDITRELNADIHAAGLNDAVLVGHSQAGMTMPQMAEFAPALFAKLVFVTCSMPLPGKTTLDQMGLGLHGQNPEQVGWPVDPLSASMEDRLALMFCNDMDGPAAAAFMGKLGEDMWPACCYSHDGWQTDHLTGIPVTYVHCLKDRALPSEWQTRFAERLHADRTVTLDAGHQTLTLETGRIARQADGAVLATYGETVVLCAVTAAKSVKEGQDFFPLTVHYQEKYFAAGRIPGGFFKRERGATEKETLVSRLIDRPVRPLFPEGFYNEINVIAHVLSYDGECEPDVLAMIAASAALTISGVPFMGPIGAARVGYKDGEYTLNPKQDVAIKEGELDLIVAATGNAVMMVESEAKELSEEIMLGAVIFAHDEIKKVVDLIIDLAEKAAKDQLKKLIGKDIAAAYKLTDKSEPAAINPIEEGCGNRDLAGAGHRKGLGTQNVEATARSQINRGNTDAPGFRAGECGNLGFQRCGIAAGLTR